MLINEDLSLSLFLIFEMKKENLKTDILEQIDIIKIVGEIVKEYKPKSDKFSTRELEKELRPHLDYIKEKSSLFPIMENFVLCLKTEILQLDLFAEEKSAKKHIFLFIENYIRNNFYVARQNIVRITEKIIKDGDHVVVVNSVLVLSVLEKAVNSGKIFDLVVVVTKEREKEVDSFSWFSKQGLDVTFVSIQGLDHYLFKNTKIFVESLCIYRDATSRTIYNGSGVVLLASFHKLETYLLSETCKFLNVDKPCFTCCSLFNSSEKEECFLIRKDLVEYSPYIKIITETGILQFRCAAQIARGFEFIKERKNEH